MGRESTHWRTGTWGDGVVDQVGSRLCHAPGAAGGEKPAPLAAERDQLVVAAVAAAQSQEAVGQDAAFEEGVELIFDELRQVGAGGVFSLGKEGRGVLLDQAVQRGLFWAVALVVDRRAIRRPLGLPANGLHARPQRLRLRSVSCAACRSRS